MRTKKALQNTIAGLSYEIVEIACSFILPRLILTSFGSDYNGITSAVAQFLRMSFLLQAGLGGVMRAALYKPLSDNDVIQISIIIKTAVIFLRKVALIFVGIAVAIACLYPFAVKESFDWLFTFSLVLIMCSGTIINRFTVAGYGYLIAADQKNSINFIINTITLIMSTAVSVIMISSGFGIHAIQLGSVLVLSLRPICLYFYVKKKYVLIKDVKTDNGLIKQRWDNFAQEVANFISINTGLVIASIFTNVFEVSVYAVYNLVAKGMWGIIRPVVGGVDAAFGNMFAKKEDANIVKGLRAFELVVFALTTLLLGVTMVMIIPFVMLYTKGITDVDYNRSLFSVLLVIATMFRCFRMPYIAIVNAVGHFKQTRNGAIVEAMLNIILSVGLVFSLGIIGIAVATLVSMVFRTIQYAIYVSRNIVRRSIFIFIKRLTLSFVCTILIVALGHYFGFGFDTLSTTFSMWIINAVIMTLIAIAIVLAAEIIFYRNDLNFLLKLFKKSVRG